MNTLWCTDPCSQTLDMECMIASIVQLLIDAMSQHNVENTSACADVTPLTMVECNKTRNITYHKAMADVHGYGDDPEAVHPC